MSVGNLLGNSGFIPEPTEHEVMARAEDHCFDNGCAGCDDCVDDQYDEATCPECEGNGGDKWNDYCLPCPMCGGDGRLW